MGCDIHCYIEYRWPGTEAEPARGWLDFGGPVDLGRSYATFAALAGVRGDLPEGGTPPRGYPEDAGVVADRDNWVYISDHVLKEKPGDAVTALMLACLARPGELAPRAMLCDELQTQFGAVADGREYLGRLPGGYEMTTAAQAREEHERQGRPYKMCEGTPCAVQCGDNHTHSWLTPDEWERAIQTAGSGPEYKAVLAVMRSFEADGYEARAVFWFDN